MKRRAFTLIEISLVLALVAIAFTIGARGFANNQVRHELRSQIDLITADLRLAQSNAMSGKNGNNHGIHLETNQYVIFEGNSYNSSDPANQVIQLPSVLQIENISLSDAGTELIFRGPDGHPSAYGSFELSAPSINDRLILTINEKGQISR